MGSATRRGLELIAAGFWLSACSGSPGSTSESTGGSIATAGGTNGGQSSGAGAPTAGNQATGGAASQGSSTGGTSTQISTTVGGATAINSATGGAVAAGGTSTGGATAAGGSATGGTSGIGGTTARNSTTGGSATGGLRATGGTLASTGTGGSSVNCGATAGPAPEGLSAVSGNGTVGLEWTPVVGASSYNVYWSNASGVTPGSGQAVAGASRGFVHRGLSNGSTYYYVVTAVTASGESPASSQISATPSGEWALEQLGTGDFASITGTCPVSPIPIASRIHVLLYPEGYTSAALPTFHSDATHAARNNDVDRWIDEVFAIEPYRLFPQAFVVWFLPRASTTDINGGNTAFAVTITSGSVTAVTGAAAPAWAALALHPYPPTLFDGPSARTARNTLAAFLIYDPTRGRAGLSGLTTSLANPNNANQRLPASFAMGHAHEFTHAMSVLDDEYMETTSTAPTRWSNTSNVVGTNQCSQLPWAHLLFGSAINPSTDQLVGAFGDPTLGYHSELLCLLNGTHDNGEFFYVNTAASSSCSQTSCTLRVNDRMCNFCREMTALRIWQRSGLLSTATTGMDAWVSQYRTPFYTTYGFKVPAKVPQSNDVSPPDNGATIFMPCSP